MGLFPPKHICLLQQISEHQQGYRPLPAILGHLRRPLQEVGGRNNIQLIENLDQGEPVLRTPSFPRDLEEAILLEMASKARLKGRNALVLRTSHLHIAYYQSPTTRDWRCVKCARQAQEGWKYTFLHCV